MSKETLIQRLQNRSARVGVVGLGYVGLPLAVEFAEAGFAVLGVDPLAPKVEKINQGVSYIPDVPTEQVKKLVEEGCLSATTDYSQLAEADAVLICVPTPLRKTRDPDMSFIYSATDSLAPYMHPGMVVVLESTTYPGTTEEVIAPRLAEARNLTIGKDVFIAFSPERVDPGNAVYQTRNTPKVVGGMTPACQEVATTLYSAAVDKVVPVSSPATAEMVKLLENTFRSVNIGLVNEMAIMCDKLGVNVWEVIDAAASKPFGFMAFYPGPGLGGHCIPIDPLYLSWKLKSLNYTARFIELASEVNTSMPVYVVSKVGDALNDDGKAIRGSKVAVLGIAYKKDIDDVRESPALDIIHLLQEKGADVSYHDPFIPSVRLDDGTAESVEMTPDWLAEADCVVWVTNHSAFDTQFILDNAQLVVDTRNATKGVSGKARVVGL
jgi:UDP-N-acetyl-D-glucosamine dehydrogenase